MLEDVPSAVLEGYSRDESAAGLDRWPELAVGIRRLLVRGGDPEAAAEQWQFDHPGHVVTEVLYSDLTRAYRNLYRLPRDIAVLLPSDGGLTTAGNAIRDGLVSAYLENDDGVTLRFYSTTDDPQSAISAYFQAAGEGAQWIIGPLRNTSVAALANLGGLGLPVLALNSFEADNSDSPRNNSLFSLSLSQEQEAKAIARRALANGWTAAILLTADNAWGQRMESAFAEEFIAGGGKVTTSAPFDPAVSDHGELLTGALMISDSHDRKNRVQATLGINLNFEPTRRDDFDVFFLAATPAQGRQIRPQLRFHEAGDKPVFAMGRIWSGIDEATANQDLNGVYFPTTNWQLQQPTGEGQAGFNSLRGGALASLHALGIDAWSVLPWLPLLRKDTDLQFPGAVGSLYMSENGQLLRDPAWAQFSRGRPVPVAWEQPEG
jgi:outer membrane PBP1 activator LpoA protein